MKTHDNDPREDSTSETGADAPGGEPNGDNHAGDAWHQASEQFNVLGSKIRDRYRDLVGDDGPGEDDVRDAFTTLGSAAQSVFDSLGDSMKDPEVRDQMKQATSTFFSAIGSTLSQLGDELRSGRSRGAETPDPTGED